MCIITPALDLAVVQDRTRPMIAEGHRVNCAVCAQIHVGQVVAHLSGPVPAVFGVTVPELPSFIKTPALDLAELKLRASVPKVCVKRHGDVIRSQIHLGQVVSHVTGCHANVSRVAEAELAAGVLTPALDFAVVQYYA
eukprot:864017-Pyramimonas_sp.AAC.1